MKNVFISGIKGNMGSRYALICHALGLRVYGTDLVSFTEQATFCRKKNIDGVIIATPTHTHIDAINIFGNQCNLPMLVEKPIRIGRVRTMPDFNVTMVNQYKYLAKENSVGLTYYNYFKTGGDGLLWDCINIIGLAKGEVSVKKESPFWRCMINGHRINIKDMDRAYFDMIKDWSRNPIGNRYYIELAHEKVAAMKNAKPTPKTSEERNQIKTSTKTEVNVIPILGRTDD